MKTAVRSTLLVLALGAAALAIAQAPGIKRTVLQKSDVGGNLEVVSAMAEISSGGSTGPHTHPGVEVGYVLEGTSTLVIEGEAPKAMKAGDSYVIPAGKVHDAKNDTKGAVKVLATYIVEKGKPLATPAPAK